MVMTVGQLKKEISTIPDEAEIYGYVGEEGIKIQAERGAGGARVPAAKPYAAGPAE